MAIYHCSVKVISRSNGRSSVGASAYRSGEKIENERDGIIHDYTNKKGIVYTELQKPEHAPDWARDRARLWNEVEKIEKAKNSQLAREVEVALPKEFTRDEQIDLIREYAKENFVDRGMVADISIHDKGDENPHAHIMLTMRPFDENGEWGAKSKKEYMLDSNGEKIKLQSGQYKSRKIDSTDWNTKESLEQWRESWANTVNRHLERNGYQERIDHRSYEKQQVEKVPTIHEGAIARKINKRGEHSFMIEKNERIKNENRELELVNIQIRQLEKERIEDQIAKEEVLKDKTIVREKLKDEIVKEEEIQVLEREDIAEELFKENKIDRAEIRFKQRDMQHDDIGNSRLERGSATSLEGEVSIEDVKVEYKKIKRVEQNRNAELQDLQNIRFKIEKYEGNIRELEKQKNLLKGIFKWKEIKRLNKAIEEERKLIQTQEKILNEEYRIDRAQIESRIKNISQENKCQDNHKMSIKERISLAKEREKELQMDKQSEKMQKKQIQDRER